MIYGALIAGAAVLATAVLVGTGWWRRGFTIFAIRGRSLSVGRLGLRVRAPDDIERVNTILQSFAGGFNTMITARSESAYQTYCASLPPLLRPFAEEGLAMGYTLRHLFRYRPEAFERCLVKRRPEFRYLYYVGLGFWSGMRNHNARTLSRVVDGLDPLHGYLCYDGYGFKHAFFDYPKKADGLGRLDELEGYARHAAYQGVGRAFFFLFMADADLLVAHIQRLGAFAPDAAAGVGLAAVFVNPDRLEVAQQLAAKMPPAWHDPFHLGMCFGLKARAINDLERFEHDLARMDGGMQTAVYAAIRECDRIELLVRSEARKDGYQRWRERVTDWLSDTIEYPMARVKPPVRKTGSEPPGLSRCGIADA